MNRHVGALAIALVAASSQAQAQDAPVGLEEIVVTAQKREQTLQNVPLSVTALGESALRNSGVIGIQDVARLAPSLSTVQNDSPSSQSYRIRGIGSDPNIPTFEPDVGLFIDGVYVPRSGLGVDDLVDLERIEILAGPQSTLYGKNVTAGVINVVTKAPSSRFEAHADLSVSHLEGGKNAMAYRASGSVSGPLADAVRARLTGVYYDQGHTTKNLVAGAGDANDMQRYALRGQVEFDLSSDTTLRLTYARSEVLDSDAQDPDLLYYGETPLLLDTLVGEAFGIAPCPDNNPNNRVICTDSPYQVSSHTNLASATLTTEFGDNTLTSITAWSNYRQRQDSGDIDQLQIPLIAQNDVQQGHTVTQEIRLASPGGGTIEWLAGAYYLHSSFDRGDDGETPEFTLLAAAPYVPLAEGIPIGQPGDLGFINSRAKSDYAAVFAQGAWRINEMFVLSAGLRWQTETKKASIDNSFQIDPATPLGINILTAALTPLEVNGSFRHETDSVTWQATGEFHPNDDTMAYLTYARGGKSGGFNIGFGSAPPADRPFGDEKVDHYEAGLKWTSPDRRIRASAAAFHTVYTDFQNAGFVSLQFLVNNADKVTTDGFEVSGEFALADGLTLNAGLTYTDAQYDRYEGGACYAGQAPDNAAGTGCDLSGRALPLIPEWKSAVALQYERDTSFGTFHSRLDWSWSSKIHTNTNLDPRHVQSAYSLLNARVGVRTAGGLDVTVWASNLFDETYIVQDAVSNLFGDDPAFQRYLGAPREIGLTVAKTF